MPYGHLKRTEAFVAVFRRGRWSRGTHLSVGVLGNNLKATRIGIRVRRGTKPAVLRNRLKRQIRAALSSQRFAAGVDVVIVIHQKAELAGSRDWVKELDGLCKKLKVAC